MKRKGLVALISTTCSGGIFGISLSLRHEYNYFFHNVNNHVHTYGWELYSLYHVISILQFDWATKILLAEQIVDTNATRPFLSCEGCGCARLMKNIVIKRFKVHTDHFHF